VFDATMSALKAFNRKRGVTRLLSFETLSSTEAAPANPSRAFLPNVFSDVTAFIERKLEIMALYETELQPFPLPRSLESIRALARYRGATVGLEYAEAFMLIRELN
jgi:LmbE family N-acetylglucosaminyl deacetylase